MIRLNINLIDDGDLALSNLVELVDRAKELEAPDNAVVGYQTEGDTLFVEWYE